MARQGFWDLVEGPRPEGLGDVRDASGKREWERWTDEQRADIYRLFFEDGLTVAEIAKEYKCKRKKVWDLMRTRPFNFRINEHQQRLMGKKLMLAQKIVDYTDEALDRLNRRANDAGVDPDLKTKIDFGLADRGGFGPKSSLDIMHRRDDDGRRLELPARDVTRANEVLLELGQETTIEAEVEEAAEEKKDDSERAGDSENSPDGA